MEAARPAETDNPAAARTERHMRMLAELGEIGMDLAREVRRQALDQAGEAPPAADLALTFSRIARAVRQTVALEAKFADDRLSAETARRTVEAHARARRAKVCVRDAVERAISSECHGETAEDLFGDLEDRLDYADETDFADRPIGELVARICRDLGVTPDWSLFEDEDWAIEERLLSPAQREGEGRREVDAGLATPTSGPAMIHPEQALASPSG